MPTGDPVAARYEAIFAQLTPLAKAALREIEMHRRASRIRRAGANAKAEYAGLYVIKATVAGVSPTEEAVRLLLARAAQE